MKAELSVERCSWRTHRARKPPFFARRLDRRAVIAPKGQSDKDLAQERRAEFAAACKVLKVSHPEVLDYPDGGLAQQDFYAMIGVLVGRLRAWRPHVVLTFGADGGVNLHRDHTIIGLAATAAFHWAGRSAYFPGSQPYAPQKLYYSGTPL